MKTRAWDGERWRTDYVVMPAGSIHRSFKVDNGVEFMEFYEIAEQVNWKLSRFTGHLDINKNEIYENHIVKLASGSIGAVEFREGSFVVDIKTHSDEFAFYEWPSEYFLKYDFDDGFIPGALIIGDVFQNPDLLEVK